jgi:hypothetical protein
VSRNGRTEASSYFSRSFAGLHDAILKSTAHLPRAAIHSTS